MIRTVPAWLAAAATCLLLPAAAQAYIGPGAGITAIGSLLGLIAALAAAIFGFLWYPIRSWRKRRREALQAPGPGAQKGTSGGR
jgi:hypothetical protein